MSCQSFNGCCRPAQELSRLDDAAARTSASAAETQISRSQRRRRFNSSVAIAILSHKPTSFPREAWYDEIHKVLSSTRARAHGLDRASVGQRAQHVSPIGAGDHQVCSAGRSRPGVAKAFHSRGSPLEGQRHDLPSSIERALGSSG